MNNKKKEEKIGVKGQIGMATALRPAIARDPFERTGREDFYEYPDVPLPTMISEAWEVVLPMFKGSETLGSTTAERLNWLVRDYSAPVEPSGDELRLSAALTLIREGMESEGFAHGRASDFREAVRNEALPCDQEVELDDEDFAAGELLAAEGREKTRQ